MNINSAQQKYAVGWREFVALPALGIDKIKAKVDTGARTSCLHTYKIEPFTQENELWVRFWIHPEQNNTEIALETCAKVVDKREVRDSGGHVEMRYVIETMLDIGYEQWPIEMTLTDRDSMRFRMLLGRTAMHGKILVDPEASFLLQQK